MYNFPIGPNFPTTVTATHWGVATIFGGDWDGYKLSIASNGSRHPEHHNVILSSSNACKAYCLKHGLSKVWKNDSSYYAG